MKVSPSVVATTARGSIAVGMSRCCTYVRSTTTGASRNASSMSPPANFQVNAWFPASWTFGLPSVSASVMSSTGSSGS